MEVTSQPSFMLMDIIVSYKKVKKSPSFQRVILKGLPDVFFPKSNLERTHYSLLSKELFGKDSHNKIYRRTHLLVGIYLPYGHVF